MRSLLLAVMVLSGCTTTSERVEPDGGVPGFSDFYGEPCTAAPSPAITVCRSATDHPGQHEGWCTAAPAAGGQGICRPQCFSSGPECPAPAVMHISTDGACYCAPS